VIFQCNLSVTCKEVGLGVSAEKCKCIFVLHQENVEQNHNIMVVNRFFENVVKLKYMGMTLTNQN
jgi:hypothetical protein